MKICYIGDATSIHTQRWVEWFAKRHEVALISTTRDPCLSEHTVVTLPQGGARLLNSYAMVRRVLHGFQPDVVHSHYINEGGWLGAASRWRPLVITAWGSDIYRAPVESRLAHFLNPWALRSADWVTCDSFDQAAKIRSWGVAQDRVTVIGWGVDLQAFHPGVDGGIFRDRLRIPQNAKVLLSPRQWLANSNIPMVVAAHERLSGDVYLILKRDPGSEPDAGGTVNQAIAASSARDRIRVLGRIGSDELPALYGAADAVISLCMTDGTPVSVLEAMALGRPIIAFKNASLSEWIDDDGGYLVDTLDPDRIARAIEVYLIDDTARKVASLRNVTVVKQRADREMEFGRMSAIYADLVSRLSDSRRQGGR